MTDERPLFPCEQEDGCILPFNDSRCADLCEMRRHFIAGQNAPTIPPEILALSQKATGGEWNATKLDGEAAKIVANNSSTAPIDMLVANSLFMGDAAFIVAVCNWVRGQIPKEQE